MSLNHDQNESWFHSDSAHQSISPPSARAQNRSKWVSKGLVSLASSPRISSFSFFLFSPGLVHTQRILHTSIALIERHMNHMRSKKLKTWSYDLWTEFLLSSHLLVWPLHFPSYCCMPFSTFQPPSPFSFFCWFFFFLSLLLPVYVKLENSLSLCQDQNFHSFLLRSLPTPRVL